MRGNGKIIEEYR